MMCNMHHERDVIVITFCDYTDLGTGAPAHCHAAKQKYRKLCAACFVSEKRPLAIGFLASLISIR